MSCSDLLREFALEPTLLNNWKDFRFYYDNFGVSEGRLISRFPSRWKRMVYDSITDECGEIQRKRIVERLSSIDEKMIRMNRNYDGQISWLDNAERSHAEESFHAIIANHNPNNNDSVLVSDEIDDETELWNCEIGTIIPRSPESMAIIVKNMFKVCDIILFVDPHFGPESARFRITLQHFLETANLTGNNFTRIEYHLLANSTSDFFKNECKNRLPQIIPNNISVNFKRWRQMEQGERIHPRYILTDKGGYYFEGGLDAGDDGETVDVGILSPSQYSQRWSNYQMESTDFELVDELTVTGIRR